MQKRGQIYLLVALVMSVVIFGLVTVTNQARQESLKSDFEKLSQNYATESARLVNSLMANPEEDIGQRFTDFSLLFTSYSKTQSPDFGLIYAFVYNQKLYVGNFLKTGLEVDCDTCGEGYPKSIDGCYSDLPASVGFDGLSMTMGIEQNKIDTLKEKCILVSEAFAVEPAELSMMIEDVPYTFTLKKDQPQVIMVSWESKGNQRKVFTEGELVEEGSVQ